MSLDPELAVLVGPNNTYRAPNGASDLPTTAISQQYNPGDLIVNGAATVGAAAFWICTTGGSSPVFSAGSALGTSLTVTVSLTAAQIIAMNGTPISVVPAPGAGKLATLVRVVFEMTTTSTVFTGGGAVEFFYHGTSTNAASSTIPASVVTNATPGTTYTYLGEAVPANGTTVLANTGIDITNATAAFAAGTGTAKIVLTYAITVL